MAVDVGSVNEGPRHDILILKVEKLKGKTRVDRLILFKCPPRAGWRDRERSRVVRVSQVSVRIYHMTVSLPLTQYQQPVYWLIRMSQTETQM